MSPAEFVKALRAVAVECRGDTENLHCEADDLLCRVLTELGYGEGVEIFKKLDKWYA